MGTSQSVPQQIKSAEDNINSLHNDIDKIQQEIIEEGNRLVEIMTNRDYLDYKELCDQISYHKVDELKDHFPIQTLNNIRYKLGLVPKPETDEMVENKETICKSIVDFYVRKVHLIKSIQNELPQCRTMENKIYNELSDKLKREGIKTEEWVNVYKKVEKFNKDIKSRNTQIKNSLEQIRKAQTQPELTRASKNVTNLLQNTTGMCKTYETDLLRFSEESEKIRVKTVGPEPKRPTKTIPVTHEENKDEENKIIKSIPMDENNEDENKIVKSIPMTSEKTENENNENLEISKPLPKESIVKGSEAIMKFTFENTKNSPKMLGLTKGTVVKVISLKDSGWAYVNAGGKKGFVPTAYLEVHN